MFFLRKNYFKIILIAILLILLAYVTNITAMPDSIILFQGEKIDLNTIFGLGLDDENLLEVSSDLNNEVSSIVGKKDVNLSLFGKINLKTVSINVIPKTKVIPAGDLVGLKLYTSGVLIVGMSEIEGIDNIKYQPYKNSGLKEGDTIVEVNSSIITSTSDLIAKVNNSDGQNIEIKYIRDGKEYTANINAAKTASNEYKLGLWVRDTAAGVGTVSFYDPETKMFAALGHGIIDIDTEELVNISKGEIVNANIVSVTKGKEGAPGEIKGSIEKKSSIGEVYKNTPFGIYGYLNNINSLNLDLSNQLEIALRDEINLGKAELICSLENRKKRKI